MKPGYLYVVEITDGIVKVGSSIHRFQRLAAYATGGKELCSWSSAPHPEYIGSEREIIDTLTARGLLASGMETFTIHFGEAVALARQIVGTRGSERSAAA